MASSLETLSIEQAVTTSSPQPGLLRLPTEIQEKIFQQVVIIRAEDGEKVTVDMKLAVAHTYYLFSVAQINRAMNQSFGNLAFESNTFAFKAYETCNQRADTATTIEYAFRHVTVDSGYCGHDDKRLTYKVGYCVNLPPIETCLNLKSIELWLPVPQESAVTASGRPRTKPSERKGPWYTDPRIPWLYPARALKPQGFTGVEKLVPKVDITHLSLRGEEGLAKLKEWVQVEVVKMNPGVEDVGVELVDRTPADQYSFAPMSFTSFE